VQQGVNLRIHPHLVTRLRMRGVIPLLTVQGRPEGNMPLATAVTYENRFYFFLTFSTAKPRSKAEAIFKTYELFIYGDKHHITN
jgi:hypothetical protein